jgi:myo-inositol 2-dehydrogenase/D-chiro-inositol 1-dehydrogenase
MLPDVSAAGKFVRVVLIGAGRIGQVHARALDQSAGALLAGIFDTDFSRASTLAGQYGAPVFANLDDALSRDVADAVVIGASSDSHIALIKQAAAHGLHVFCEKPLALTQADIMEAIAACRAAGVALQVGFNRRFDPNALEIANGVHAGRIGRALTMRVISRDPAPPPREFLRRSGGLIHDVSIHDFDLCRFVLREEPVSVLASGVCLIDPMFAEEGDIDVVSITLRFPSGAIAVIENTRATAYGYDQRVEVFGREGAYESDNHTAHRVVFRDPRGQTAPLPLPFFVDRYEIAFNRQMQSFVRAVASENPVGNIVVSGNDALRVHRICDAAALSLREDRLVRIEQPHEGKT